MPQAVTRRAASLTILLASCLGLALAGCAGAPAQARLPRQPRAAAAPAAAASQPPLSPRQQVVAAYTGYSAAMTAAFGSRSAARARQLLAPYLNAATITNAVRAFSQAWSRDEVSYGAPVRHILSVQIQGNAAWVHECDDTSASGLEDAKTGQIVPGSLGIPDLNLVTRLNRVGGRWMVGVQTIEDVPCKA